MSFVINLLKVGPDKKLFLEDKSICFLILKIKINNQGLKCLKLKSKFSVS